MNKEIVVVGVLGLLLLSIFAVGFMSGNAKGYAMKISDGGVKGYTLHGVIRINNDTDFANQASQEGWQGDGSQSNPYIISGYDIDAHGAGDAIYIGNTTVYFIVENCYLHNASSHSWPYFDGDGIMLYHVKNGKISRNTIMNNGREGIIVYSSSSNNIIIGNNITNNNGNGIYLDSSNSNTISDNSITNSKYGGISLWDSNSNTISGNSITNSRDGIYLGSYIDSSSSNNIVTGNNITNNRWEGIYVDFSDSNTISSNNIMNNPYGIVLHYSSSNTIYKNLISNSTNYGAYASSHSVYNLIYNNSFYYNNDSGDKYNLSHMQAYDNGTNNYWNSSAGIGNYWHDWANNNDTNDMNPQDGIVDWPYKIDGSSGSKDYYPLKNATYLIPPLPPRNLTAVPGDGYVNLTWENPRGNGSSPITQYNIYRNGVLIKIKTVSGNQLWFNDTSVQNGQTYKYYVTAVNSVGESDKSNEVQATPQGAVPEFSTGIWVFMVVLISLLGVMKFRKFS